MYRSTKGASKARRDQINAEIRSLKDLLPISDADKTRLSYLHIMSLACIYTRKSVFFSQETEGPRITGNSLSFPELSELLHTLSGFLLVLTSEGKLLYLSDNVTEHLGHTMVDLVAQSDSVYDIIEPADHFVVRGNLVPITTPDTDRLFRCRFSTSKFARRQGSGNKLALVRARCLSPPHASSYWTSNPVWVCFCSPLECNVPHVSSARNPLPTPPAEQSFLLACFQSQHGRDMRIHTVQDSVTLYLGYNTETLKLRSWYSLIHPRDLAHASAQHCALLHEGGEKQVEMVVQVEAADHSWVWLYIVLQLETGEFPIICQNYLISESEAWSVRQQLYSDQNQLALLYQEKAQCSDPLSSPDQVFTPSSSGLSTQSFDFSFTLSGRSSSEEQPPSSITIGPESFPSLNQDHERHSQQPSSHQMWLSESQEPASGSNNNSVYSTLSQAHGPPLPSFKDLMRQSSEDFIYTPPYTPRTARKRFLFGDEPYKSEQSKARKIRQSMISTNGPPSVEVSVGSAQHCSKRLYETLPPTPDSPGSDECIMMALPEITGPLFVDVPHFSFHPPEGLLTPEASPKKPRLDFFPQGQTSEQEQMEISLLAQYISSLADGFCHNHPQGRTSPSSDAPHPTSPPSPTTTLEGSNSSLAHIDVFMFEEKSFDGIPLPNQSTEPPSPYSSCTYTTPAPTSCYTHEVVTTNLCSAQPARFNCVASVEQEAEKPEETFTEDVSAFSGPITSQAFPALAPALPCAQSLLEELATMEPVFGASASMNHAKRQQDELHQLPPQDRQQIFYQDGTSDHMF